MRRATARRAQRSDAQEGLGLAEAAALAASTYDWIRGWTADGAKHTGSGPHPQMGRAADLGNGGP
jgi:hypothetical protein